MRQLKAPASFPLQFVQKRAVEHNDVRQEFERHLALQFFVPRQPDDSHPATSQDLIQRVAIKDLLTPRVIPRGYVEPEALVSHVPVEKDSYNGVDMIQYFAVIAAWVGEKDLAGAFGARCWLYSAREVLGTLRGRSDTRRVVVGLHHSH